MSCVLERVIARLLVHGVYLVFSLIQCCVDKREKPWVPNGSQGFSSI